MAIARNWINNTGRCTGCNNEKKEENISLCKTYINQVQIVKKKKYNCTKMRVIV